MSIEFLIIATTSIRWAIHPISLYLIFLQLVSLLGAHAWNFTHLHKVILVLYLISSYIFMFKLISCRWGERREISKRTFSRLNINLFIFVSFVRISLFLLHLPSGLSKLEWKVCNEDENWCTFLLSCYMINATRIHIPSIVTIFLLHFTICTIPFIPPVLLSIYFNFSFSIFCVLYFPSFHLMGGVF